MLALHSEMLAVVGKVSGLGCVALIVACGSETGDDGATGETPSSEETGQPAPPWASAEPSGPPGSETEQLPAANGMGQVTSEWLTFCIATFTESATLTDTFDEPLFTVAPGERFLLTAFGDDFGEPSAKLVYLSEGGPYEAVVSANTLGEFPFTSNCTYGAGKSYIAASTEITRIKTASSKGRS